jgi:hypothetical protein
MEMAHKYMYRPHYESELADHDGEHAHLMDFEKPPLMKRLEKAFNKAWVDNEHNKRLFPSLKI